MAAQERILKVERVFKAPRELVWNVYTQAEFISQWYGPKGMTTRVETNDFKVGGRWRYVMVRPDGVEYPVEGTYLEIQEPERIVAIDKFSEGLPTELMGLPESVTFTTLFTEIDAYTTRLTLISEHSTKEQKEMHEKMGVSKGWMSSFEKMDGLLQELLT